MKPFHQSKNHLIGVELGVAKGDFSKELLKLENLKYYLGILIT